MNTALAKCVIYIFIVDLIFVKLHAHVQTHLNWHKRKHNNNNNKLLLKATSQQFDDDDDNNNNKMVISVFHFISLRK